MGGLVLFFCQKFSWISLLEFDDVRARIFCKLNKFFGNLNIAHMVASDFRDYVRFFVFHNPLIFLNSSSAPAQSSGVSLSIDCSGFISNMPIEPPRKFL